MRPVLLLFLCCIISPSSIYADHEHGYQEASRSDGSKAGREGESTSQDNGVGEPLFLTPLIESGKYEEALHKSRVGKIGDVPCVLSYSGFITINKDLGSNLFFWFIPAMESPENAPVALWLQGGPGSSSLFGLFVEHGPYFVDENGAAQLRPITWTRTISVLYVDNPVGAGFSFTQSEKGHARNQSDVSRDMLEMLQQFFTLFSKYSSNDFYLFGESYAGKFVPSIGAALHKSKGKLRVPINFKGIAIGNGMIDPITMLLYGDFLYDIGLLDRNQASHMQGDCDRIARLIREKNYLEATALTYSTVLGVVTGYPSYLGNVTGFEYGYNYLLTEKPESHSRYTSFIITPMVRQAIHVGQRSFNNAATNVAVYFAKDLMQSVRDQLALLLDNSYKDDALQVSSAYFFSSTKQLLSWKNYNRKETSGNCVMFCVDECAFGSLIVLLYSGPLDIIVPYAATEALMYSLKWSGSKKWSKAEQKIWRSSDGKRVHGYTKDVKNCRLVLVRNGGHILPYDQPEAAYEMITRFVNNVPLAK